MADPFTTALLQGVVGKAQQVGTSFAQQKQLLLQQKLKERATGRQARAGLVDTGVLTQLGREFVGKELGLPEGALQALPVDQKVGGVAVGTLADRAVKNTIAQIKIQFPLGALDPNFRKEFPAFYRETLARERNNLGLGIREVKDFKLPKAITFAEAKKILKANNLDTSAESIRRFMQNNPLLP